MKSKTVITLICIGFVLTLTAQKPETVYSVAKVYKPHTWYVEQAGVWWKVIRDDQKNEEAWFNYFKACRMAKISHEQPTDWKSSDWAKESPYLKEGDEIIKLIDLNIPDTFTANYVKWWNRGSDPGMNKYLLKAYELGPSNPDLYDDLVIYYETLSDREKRVKYNREWFSLNDMSPGLLSFCYNMLQTAKPGSIIITGGDNDTFPVWMLQDVQGIGKDIGVINLHTLNIAEYRKKTFERLGIPSFNQSNDDGSTTENNLKLLAHIIKNKPENITLYLSLALWQGYYSDFEKNLYIVGNLLQYSKKSINNIALIEENFLKEYAMDCLKFDAVNDISKEIVNQMNVNYLPGLIKLFEHYKSVKLEEKAAGVKKTGMLIAEKAGGECSKKALEAFKD